MMAKRLLVIINLLCLLTLSCNARHYGMNHEDSLNQSHKVLEKFEEKIERLEGALHNSHGRITSTIIIDHDQVSSISPHIRPRKSRKIMKQKREARISVVAKKSVVSWRIPSKHRHDQHPGVYSDYPEPRSRPPSHN